MIEAAKAYAKLFSSRIVYRDKIIAEYSELENTSWLNRKEKFVMKRNILRIISS